MPNLIRFSRGSVPETKKVLLDGEYSPVIHIPFTKDLWLVGNERYADYFRDMKKVEPFSHIPWVARYIYGHYHCDKCPMCWSDYSYECGDGDCGCYIFGERRDSCRLIPPFRHLVGWHRKRKAEYFAAHQYDGMADYYEELYRKQECMRKAIKKGLHGYELIHRDMEGKPIPVCTEEFLEMQSDGVFYEYEGKAYPFNPTTLREEWGKFLRKTWDAFANHFRPFLPEKKQKKKKEWWEEDFEP